MGRSNIAIIIPAKNEALTIKKVISHCSNYGTVIVIDDASRDETGKISKLSGAIVLKNKKNLFYDESLNKGFNYLEDLHFSFNLTQKKFKHLVIAKAKVSNPNLVSRNDLNFGFIEILNRYKFVETYKLNKINFYITAFIRMLYLITNILHLKTSWILRFFGNLKGIISCIILDINKKIN